MALRHWFCAVLIACCVDVSFGFIWTTDDACSGPTQLINFDDVRATLRQGNDGTANITTDPPTSSGYKGFTWYNFGVIKPNIARVPIGAGGRKKSESGLPTGKTNRGYNFGVVSKQNVALNWYGRTASLELLEEGVQQPFSVCSIYATAVYYDNLPVTFIAYYDGGNTESYTAILSATSPTLVELDFESIIRLDVDPRIDNPNAEYCDEEPANKEDYPDWYWTTNWRESRWGCHVAMDNLVVAIKP